MVSGLEGIMNLAAASGENLGTTSDIVTDALTAFGKSAEDSGRLADIMAAASSNANTNVSMMGETFKYAAPVAGALGYSMEDTSVAIGLMANAGIKASQAGTSIRAGLTNLVKPAKQAAEAMDQYKISVTDDDGRMLSFRELIAHLRDRLGGLDSASQAAAAAAIFGKNAMSGWLAVINASDEDIDKLTAAVDGSTGAAQRMADTMQDNLAGKVTILKSALESLGIAAYDYVKGPLSGVVEGVTGIINGITSAIAPQRSEFERFVDDIDQLNAQVDRSISHAKETVSQGEAKAAEIEMYKGVLDEVLTSCEQFNYVDLGDGKYQILDATGAVVEEGFQKVDAAAGTTEGILEAWASGGFNTDGISQSSEDAQDMIGYVADKADTVETRLERFASQGFDVKAVEQSKDAIVQIFDDMGREVGSYQTTLTDWGEVEIDTTNFENASEAVVTVFNNLDGEVQSFKGSIDGLNKDVTLVQVTDEFTKVEDSVRKTYVITDEFTKAKISGMVDALGDSVIGLADAWNEQTGELTASHDELLKWFDTAKEVAMYEALENALHELYDAWGTAAVECAKSTSALNTALDNYNAAAGTSFETAEDLRIAMTKNQAPLNDYNATVLELALKQKDANDQLAVAGEELDSTAKALQPLKESLDSAKQSTEDAGISAEEAAQNLSALEEAEEEVEEATETLTEAQQGAIDKYEALFGATDEYLQKQEELTATDLADWCEEHVTKYLQKVTEEFDKLTQSVSDSMTSFVTSMQTTTEEGNVSLEVMVNSLLDKQEKVRQWSENMAVLGQMAGNGFSQALYDDLLREGPEKGYEKVQAIVDAMYAQTPEFEALSREYDNALALTASPANLVSYSSTGKEYASAMQAGFEGSIVDYYDAVENGVQEAADTASDAAEDFSEAGEKSGEKTAEGIEGTSAQVTKAAEDMVDSAKQASDKIATNFFVTGQQIPQELRRGINIGKTWSDKAMEDVVKSMDDILKGSNETFRTDGEDLIRELKAGIDAGSPDAIQSVTDMLQEIRDISDNLSYDLQSAGENAAHSFANGIANGSGEASGYAHSMAQGAYDSVDGYYSSFETAGQNMSIGLGNGINNGASYVINSAYNMAINALNAAKGALGIASPSKAFMELGGFAMKGFGIGIEDGSVQVIDTIGDAMDEVKDTAAGRLAGLSIGSLTGSVSISSDDTGVFSGLAKGFSDAGAGIAAGLHGIGEAGRDELDELSASTDALMQAMDMTAFGASTFFDQLAAGADKAMQSALAMQSLQQAMDSTQNGIMDMAAVISALLDQMSGLSQAVSGMELNPSVSVQIGNKAIDNYITTASVRGMAQAQRNIQAAQGR